MKIEGGVFTISLDFELYWGMRDVKTLDDYKQNLLGTRKAINDILHLFKVFDISATWSCVGLLMAKNSEECKIFLPTVKPSYENANLSPYTYLSSGKAENFGELHFAPDVITDILKIKNQRVGTHTFSHYYTLEKGQTKVAFNDDIKSAIEIAKDIEIKSIVFPRNQCNEDYLSILPTHGISCYRGTENNWLSQNPKVELLQKALRLVDSYVNLTGHNTYPLETLKRGSLVNVPASRFLRPYNKTLDFVKRLKLRRIKSAMTHAAINNELYHLWWHPHNFGVNTEQNIDFLREILEHFDYLNSKYRMVSLNMETLSEVLQEEYVNAPC